MANNILSWKKYRILIKIEALIMATNNIMMDDSPYSSAEKEAIKTWRASVRALGDDGNWENLSIDDAGEFANDEWPILPAPFKVSHFVTDANQIVTNTGAIVVHEDKLDKEVSDETMINNIIDNIYN